MLTIEENERLTRVGAGTPMGGFLRRHWVAALLSSELPEPGGPPKRLRLLGEDFVAFRDSSGAIGILDLHCPHRGADLSLARNEGCALQCIYHGWQIDIGGNVISTPNEPPFSRFKERVHHGAYPVVERGGIAWTYLGPAGTEPPLPAFEWLDFDDEHLLVEKVLIRCNWLQAIENSLDASHTPFLHSDTLRPETELADEDDRSAVVDRTGSILEYRPSVELNAKVEIDDAPFGFRISALRNPLEHPERDVYARTSLYIAPWYYAIPPPPGRGAMPFYIPMDDEHTMLYNARYSFAASLDEPGIRKLDGTRLGEDLGPDFSHRRSVENDWLQDREAMVGRANYSGIRGVIAQDLVALESMGPIFDRTREHLGASDITVVRARAKLLEALTYFEERNEIADFHAGTAAVAGARAWQKVIAREIPWQAVDPTDPSYFSAGPLLAR